jgi:YHS domain-containing protein
MKQFINTFFIGSLLFVFSSLSFAGEQYTKRGYAVSGYDPVAYFTIGEATKGDKNISAEWNDVKWLFSTEEHKNLFLANPESYIKDGDENWKELGEKPAA